jgi:hypothetical protein
VALDGGAPVQHGRVRAAHKESEGRIRYGGAWFCAASDLPLDGRLTRPRTMALMAAAARRPRQFIALIALLLRTPREYVLLSGSWIMYWASSQPVFQPASAGDPQESPLPRGVAPAGGPCGLLAWTPSPRAEDEPPKSRDRWHSVRGHERLGVRRRRGLGCPAPTMGPFARGGAACLDGPFLRARHTAGNDRHGRARSRRRPVGSSGGHYRRLSVRHRLRDGDLPRGEVGASRSPGSGPNRSPCPLPPSRWRRAVRRTRV